MQANSNNRILIIPDVHGRTFWRDAVEAAGEMPVVFLGDYLDPYPDEWISRQEAWDELQAIVALKKAQPERVTLLLGNHDLAYVNSALKGSRFDQRNARRNRAYFFENLALFDMTFSLEMPGRPGPGYGPGPGRRYLLSHAGILPGWVSANERLFGTDDDIGDRLNELLHDDSRRFPFMLALSDVSFIRGGLDLCGSPVWADVSEHAPDRFEWDGVYQIFGHSRMPEAIITPYWACLDCGRAFVLEADKENDFLLTL